MFKARLACKQKQSKFTSVNLITYF